MLSCDVKDFLHLLFYIQLIMIYSVLLTQPMSLWLCHKSWLYCDLDFMLSCCEKILVKCRGSQFSDSLLYEVVRDFFRKQWRLSCHGEWALSVIIITHMMQTRGCQGSERTHLIDPPQSGSLSATNCAELCHRSSTTKRDCGNRAV